MKTFSRLLLGLLLTVLVKFPSHARHHTDSMFFNADSLAEYIRMLMPVSGRLELEEAESILRIKNPEAMKSYLQNFWYLRNPTDPEMEWKHYCLTVEKVQAAYSTPIRKGYETDRGRIRLKYGLPDAISKFDHEPSSYPYEIWHYYKTQDHINVRFVFADTDLVTNDYILIHSDAPGEHADPSWHYQLQRRNTLMDNVDRLKSPSRYGEKSKEYYENPR